MDKFTGYALLNGCFAWLNISVLSNFLPVIQAITLLLSAVAAVLTGVIALKKLKKK